MFANQLLLSVWLPYLTSVLTGALTQSIKNMRPENRIFVSAKHQSAIFQDGDATNFLK